jgi:ATP-dependent DNA helicase RecG
MSFFDEIKDTLPESIIKKYDFIEKKEALKKLHFPKNKQDIEIAKYRLAYEELFEINYKTLSKKFNIFKQTE